ncbi:MAG: phosphotransferase [Aureispira sp.]
MQLTEKNIHHYLLDKGYLNPVLLMQGKYKVESDRTRNAIFKVYLETGQSIFVKQLVEIHSQNAYLIQKDATVHRLFQQTDCYQGIRAFVPELLGYDADNQVLATELFPYAKSLMENIQENKAFSITHANIIGEILHAYHQPIQETLKNTPTLQFFNEQLPWILTIGDAKGLADSPNGAVIKYMLNTPDIVNGLERIRTTWQATSLIHGDIKWMNFVCTTEGKLKLIDWEIANIGDPLWDVGGVLQSYLSSWIFSFDNNNAWHAQKVQGQEFVSIPAIQAGIQAFWKTYVQLQKWTEEEANTALITSTRMAGARLLQTAFEANQQPQILPNTMRAIQLCQHLFNHPEQAIKELFGLTTLSYASANN